MISRMKKVCIICTGESRETTLHALQEMGLLHLEHMQEPGGAALEEARASCADVMRAAEALKPHAPNEVRPDAPSIEGLDLPRAAAAVKEVLALLRRRKEIVESLEQRLRERDRIAPFGTFDPGAIGAMAGKGLHISLHRASPKEAIAVPDDAVCTIHQHDKTGIYFSVLSRAPLSLPYEQIRVPEFSLTETQAKIADLENAQSEIDKALTRHADTLPLILDHADHMEDKVQFLEAREGMGTSAPLAYICGYCPEGDADTFRASAAEHGWGVMIEDVKATDPVPTKIDVPKWVKPIRVVFGFIGVVPGYEEVDISAVFLLFFSLFFAMIVGDAGYGVLFLVGTILAHRRFKKGPASAFHLLYITSIGTIIWGALTGNYFGITGMPAVFQSMKIDWLNETENIMLVCFLIGAAHLTIAHLWNFARRIRSLQGLAQIGSICVVWTMFFLARFLVLNKEFPRFMFPVFAAGILMLILFMTPARKLKTEWFNHVMLPLNLVSNFVDVVSYVRLFAVGTATLAVASAFNGMAMDIGAGSRIGIVFAVLIIFLGHALNIALAAMGVLVHGIRLNTLEFAGHLGLQWTGIRFLPFSRKSDCPPFPASEKKLPDAAERPKQNKKAA